MIFHGHSSVSLKLSGSMPKRSAMPLLSAYNFAKNFSCHCMRSTFSKRATSTRLTSLAMRSRSSFRVLLRKTGMIYMPLPLSSSSTSLQVLSSRIPQKTLSRSRMSVASPAPRRKRRSPGHRSKGKGKGSFSPARRR